MGCASRNPEIQMPPASRNTNTLRFLVANSLGVFLAPQRTHPLVCTSARSYIYISCMNVSVHEHLNTRMHTHAHASHSGKSPKNGPKMQRIWVSGGISGFLEAFLEARPPISGGTFLDSGGTNFWRHTFSGQQYARTLADGSDGSADATLTFAATIAHANTMQGDMHVTIEVGGGVYNGPGACYATLTHSHAAIVGNGSEMTVFDCGWASRWLAFTGP